MVVRFYFIVLMFDRIIRLSQREKVRVRKMFFPVDCKTIGLFLKVSKEIGKAWRKSLKREAREPHSPAWRVRREKKNLALPLLLCEM